MLGIRSSEGSHTGNTPDGENLTSFPADLSILDKCTVEYVDFQGWQSSTKGARAWSHLPSQAQKYIEFIESSVGIKVVYIGTGQDREDIIFREWYCGATLGLPFLSGTAYGSDFQDY